jgi:2-polyprenyl-6-methoxyphenol hydroxylase-like FAD-dependent oxidoreductase
LATAIALRMKGIESEVFEQSSAIRATGGALLLWSNAIRSLRALGLEPAIMAVGAPVERIEFRTARGELLTSLDIERLSRQARAASVLVSREDLLTILSSALPAAAIHTDARFLEYRAEENGQATATFAGGAASTADLLVGADGLHSTVRAQVCGAGPLRETGQIAFVGVARAEGALDTGTPIATVGAGLRFWSGPLRDAGVYWYATVRATDAVSRDPDVAKRQLLELFGGWHEPIGELIEGTPSDQIIRTAIADRRPVERWGAGPITLVGDAAHPCTPDLGQGACQALESAVGLAECLEGADDIVVALRRYENRRIARTSRVTELSFVTAIQSAVDHPLACALRDLGVRSLLVRIAEPELRWLMA